MKIETYQYPKSSFLSVEKDMSLITSYLLKNERLKRLLFYTTPDCLDKPNLTDEQSIGLIHKNIKIVPKLYVDGSVLNYIILSFDNFTENAVQTLYYELLEKYREKTSKANITVTIKGNNGETSVSSSAPNTFKITYKVECSGKTEYLSNTIVVKGNDDD